jgi:hypothetical protein
MYFRALRKLNPPQTNVERKSKIVPFPGRCGPFPPARYRRRARSPALSDLYHFFGFLHRINSLTRNAAASLITVSRLALNGPCSSRFR